MKGNSKKASQEMTLQKLITIVLVLLVLIAVTIFLFKPDVLNWIKNLPGYSEPEDRTIDYNQIPEDQLALLKCDYIVQLSGKIKDVALYQKLARYEIRSISIFDRTQKKSMALQGITADTKNGEDYIIELIRNGKNIEVGHMINRKISILPEVLSGANNPEYSELFSKIGLEDLKLLDGAVQINNLDFCKKGSKTENVIDQVEMLSNRGTSNIISLIFTIGLNDQVDLLWNFQNSKVMIMLKPNGNTFSGECGGWITNSDSSCFDSSVVKKDIYPQDIILIKQILSSPDPQQLATNIFNIIQNGRRGVEILDVKNKYITLDYINNLLYGLDYLPYQDQLTKLKETQN